jgi:glycerophosphoryl diester phosphodiesterase
MNSINRSLLLFTIVLATACSTSKKTPAVTAVKNFPNKVVAHRGAFKNTGVPENSIASLQAAIKMGCGGSEFDIHMTADSVLVVNHDHTFQGIPIETSTYAELLVKKHSNGESIPKLDDYIKAGLGQSNTILVAEIKPSKVSKARSLALAQKVVELVKQLNASPMVAYISFDYDILKKVRELDPAAPLQYLNGDASAEKLQADGFGADYHYNVFQKDPNWIRNARKLGVVVNAWTVNDPAMMDALLAENIDLITTNEPELLLKKLGK